MNAKKILFKAVVGCLLLNTTSNLKAQTNAINPTGLATNFNVFTSGDAIAVKTESEGSWAVGGDFTLDGILNIFGGVNYYNNDVQPTALVVHGKVNYLSGRLQILENNHIKIGDLSSSTIFEVDNNNVSCNTRIVPVGGQFDSTPSIALSTSQNATSISGNTEIDFAAAFSQFESISEYMGAQDTNVEWDVNEFSQGKLWVDLIPNTTNVINLTVAEFNGLQEIKFTSQVPSETSPFIVNITDAGPETLTIHSWPNIVGSPLSYASYILYNFANVGSTIDYVGGAQVYGTIYAPRAGFNNRSNFNIDGQIIVETFEQNSGEVHPYIFDATIDFSEDPSIEEICDGIDNDGDGLVDEGFSDTDGDGVADCVDNCPDTPNAYQMDSDGDGVGDACSEVEYLPTRVAFGLEVYPIPFDGEVNLKYSSLDTSGTIEIYDINGHLLKRLDTEINESPDNNVLKLDLRDTAMEHQVLFVRFATREGVIVKRLLTY